MGDLVKQIAMDLVIDKFDDEINEQYGNRIIYCALVAWAKVQILEKAYTSINEINIEYFYISKQHIIEKLKYITEGILNSVPHIETWINENEERDLSEYIINNLIFCYQVSKTYENRLITASPKQVVHFINNKLIIGGTDWNNREIRCYSVGLGIWQKNEKRYDVDYKERFNIPKCSLEDYYKSIEENALWNNNELDDEYEYFCGGSGVWHNKAWKIFNEKYIPNGISLIRKRGKRYDYKLLLLKNGKIFTAKLDKWYKNENEVSRIMYALEYYRKKPAEFKAKKKSGFIELHCHSNIPNAEKRILLMSSWPKRKYNDNYLREIPECLWDDIEYVLNGLGIKVIFE